MNDVILEETKICNWQTEVERDALAALVAEQIGKSLTGVIAAQNRASILLSGGSTPVRAYQLLAQQQLPWDRVQMSLTDERRVSDGHPDSNAVMIWQKLLVHRPQVEWYPLWQNGWQSEDLPEVVARVAELQRPFDIVLLGMGEDGHFASLFPGCDESERALQGDAALPLVLTRSPNPPAQRISWSMQSLIEAKQLMLYITGKRKREIIERAQHADTAESKLPIAKFLSALKQRQLKLTIFWAP